MSYLKLPVEAQSNALIWEYESVTISWFMDMNLLTKYTLIDMTQTDGEPPSIHC
jgi:hypothetical protein